MSKGHITVLSCGIGSDSITDQIKEIVNDATLLAGAQRLLDLFPDFKGDKIVIGKGAGETISYLEDLVLKEEKEICVLASGDALFHGIGKTFSKSIPADQLRVIPNITAMQAMAAELCLPWNKIQFFSVHGNRDGVFPLRQIVAANSAMIYADPKCTAAKLAKMLVEKFPEAGDRPAAIGQQLGSPDATISSGTLLEMSEFACSGLSILVMFQNEKIGPGLPLGLADEKYAHQENLITHPEIRAVALSKLRLGCVGVMWDLGAGSGSVGIEAAGLCPGLVVYSVEKNANRIKDIETNIQNFGVANVQVKTGNALEVIDELPAPRSVFIGGGGNDVANILEKSFAQLLPGGIIVATAVLLETRIALSNVLKDNCIEVVSLSVSRAKTLGASRMMKSDNNIEMYVYRKSEN